MYDYYYYFLFCLSCCGDRQKASMSCKHFILWVLNLHNHYGILASAHMIFFRTMESTQTILLALTGLWDISRNLLISSYCHYYCYVVVTVIMDIPIKKLLLWIYFDWWYIIYLVWNCLFNYTVLRLWFMMCRQYGRSYLGILDDVECSLSLLDIPFTDINNLVSSKSYNY